MLLCGPTQCIKYLDQSEFKIYNFTGMIEGFNSLQCLIPPLQLGKSDSYEFDVNYYNYIMNYDNNFLNFFRIIQSLYVGKSVYLISDEAEWSESITESLLKIIQQRYGYNAYCIHTEEDILFAIQRDESKFNPYYGLYNLDQDKARYQYIVKNISIHNPGGFVDEYFME